nr:5055_t:CDS:2 [Entrophospora candida]CAG8629684.1 7965_t:CDS:2 [Entrophospora candida]
MGIKIIGFGKSPITLRVILTLQELGLEHEFEEAVYNEMKSPEFHTTKNPLESPRTKNSTILIPKDIQKATLVEQYLSVEKIVAVKYMGKEANAEKVKEAKEKLEQTLDVYEKFLKGKDYLTGEYSLADIIYVPNLFANIHKTSVKDIYYDTKRPNVIKWVKNLLETPTWKQIAANLNSN